MKVLACGSRTFTDAECIGAVLHGLDDMNDGDITLIEGGAPGADSIAGEWAASGADFGIRHEQYPADWDQYGKRAGYVRNQQMLDEGKPDVVWAFVDKPLEESRGTAMMVRLAREAGLPTYVVEARHGV